MWYEVCEESVSANFVYLFCLFIKLYSFYNDLPYKYYINQYKVTHPREVTIT